MTSIRTRFLLVATLALLFVAGCDTVTTPESELITERAKFTFTIEANEFQPEKVKRLRSLETIDLTERLQQAGYSGGEVIAARIVSARLERIRPLGVDLNFLANVSLDLTGSSGTESVASLDELPADESVNLPVAITAPITHIVTRPFGLILALTPTEVPGNAPFRFEVEVAIQYELEGA